MRAREFIFEAAIHDAPPNAVSQEEKHRLAPNGQPSNLNPVQYVQVRTPAFKSWFGNWESSKTCSKILDENGEPQVMYHGTSADIAEFSSEFLGTGVDQYGSGFYFTSAKHTASGYANETGAVYPTFLNVRKPLLNTKLGRLSYTQIQSIIMLSPDLDDSLANYGDVKYEGKHKVMREAIMAHFEYQDGSTTILETLHALGNDFFKNSASAFLQAIKQVLKYDGVMVKFDNEIFVVAFESNQIKSAIGNTGGFKRKVNTMTSEESQ
jgi:hypothetical protein